MDSESVVAQAQRKIELQSPDDLAYLVTNVRAAAAALLDEAFPHVDGRVGDDDLRDPIEALVNQYIDQTFALAAPNLSINGMPVAADDAALTTPSNPSAPEAAYEPFDTRKRQRVADLVTQEEKLLEEVAALKRSVPAAVASDRADRRAATTEADDAALRDRARAAADVSVALALADLDRQAGVEASFGAAVQALARLKRDMPAVVAKMERARLAGEYVLADRK